jgi:hypothetical protein
LTSHPSIKQRLIDENWDYSDEPIVVHDRVITAQG